MVAFTDETCVAIYLEDWEVLFATVVFDGYAQGSRDWANRGRSQSGQGGGKDDVDRGALSCGSWHGLGKFPDWSIADLEVF